jgi:hypothetical protein
MKRNVFKLKKVKLLLLLIASLIFIALFNCSETPGVDGPFSVAPVPASIEDGEYTIQNRANYKFIGDTDFVISMTGVDSSGNKVTTNYTYMALSEGISNIDSFTWIIKKSSNYYSIRNKRTGNSVGQNNILFVNNGLVLTIPCYFWKYSETELPANVYSFGGQGYLLHAYNTPTVSNTQIVGFTNKDKVPPYWGEKDWIFTKVN